MTIAKTVSEFYMSDYKDTKLKKKVKGFQGKKDKVYDCTYLGVPCKLINSRKIMREVEFKDGSKTTIIYNELNS
jgi:hypothetical protein